VGAYGLTWVTLVLAAIPAVLFDPISRRAKAAALAALALGLAGLYGGGALRLSRAAPVSPAAPMVRIVQADIDQKEKWRPENLDLIVTTYAALTTRPAAARPDVVVWPEGALPAVADDLLAPGSPYAGRLGDMLRPGQTLMMGANRAGLGPSGGVDYFNSLIALRREDAGLRVTGVYDKYRLVPFGEFVPLGDIATRVGLRSLVHMPEDFTAGPLPRPIAPDGLPRVQPLICYEALFPGFTGAAAKRAGAAPDWILNVSNDAWFGVTSGPLQHLNLASYRAIEEGLPMVRSTPTGVSAMIDAYGRIAPGDRLEMGETGVIDARLPPKASSTPYNRHRDAAFAFMLLVSAVSCGVARIRRR
jgi:apolipoprotein N-acyltransferase